MSLIVVGCSDRRGVIDAGGLCSKILCIRAIGIEIEARVAGHCRLGFNQVEGIG